MKGAILLSLIFISCSYAQFNREAFNMLFMPHSVQIMAAGQQGAALPSDDDAMIYNPARLSFTRGTKLSFYRNPYQWSIFQTIPLTTVTLHQHIKNIGYFGISYDNWSWGEFETNGFPPFNIYDRSFSLAYAAKFSGNFSAGIQLRYAEENQTFASAEGYFLSTGVVYATEFLNRNVTVGLSLMNMGPKVKFKRQRIDESDTLYYHLHRDAAFYGDPPSEFNLGGSIPFIENDYFQVPLNLSISKAFKDRENGFFYRILEYGTWLGFPIGRSISSSISYIWKPLSVGKGVYFLQEYYLGSYSAKNKQRAYCILTHGVSLGFDINGVVIKAGYGGISHNVDYNHYSQLWYLPYETFQFTVQYQGSNDYVSSGILEQIIISFGSGYTVRNGTVNQRNYSYYDMSPGNSLTYNAESSFYFNKNNALITSFLYSSVPYQNSFGNISSSYETMTFFASYRYHPFEWIIKWYLQGGAGIYRLNPANKFVTPKYDYKNILQAAIGGLYNISSDFLLIPEFQYNSIIFPSAGPLSRMKFLNQFIFCVKIGYRIL